MLSHLPEMAQVFHPVGKKVPKIRRVRRKTEDARKGSRGRQNSLQLSEKGGWGEREGKGQIKGMKNRKQKEYTSLDQEKHRVD